MRTQDALDKLEARLAAARKVSQSELSRVLWEKQDLPDSLTDAQRNLLRQGWDAGYAEAMRQSIGHLLEVREADLSEAAALGRS